MWMNMMHNTLANTWKVHFTDYTLRMCRERCMALRGVQHVSFYLKYKSFFSVSICYSVIWSTLRALLNWCTSLDPKLWKNIGMLLYLQKNTPAPWISLQMKINKAEATCLGFSCCRNYLLQCTVLLSEKEMISLPLTNYPIQHNMVGIGFNCLAAAKVLLILELRDLSCWPQDVYVQKCQRDNFWTMFPNDRIVVLTEYS